jgi:hypothetical protein
MNSSFRPASKLKSYEIKTKNLSQANGFEDSIAKLSREETALLEEVNLQEWRKNLMIVRARSKS